MNKEQQLAELELTIKKAQQQIEELKKPKPMFERGDVGLDICKRIAWLDNHIELCTGSCVIKDTFSYCHDIGEDGYNIEYNPLEDDNLCFQLMKKYKVERIINNSITYYYISGETPLYPVTKDCNDNKTVCKVIIKAKGCSV